MNIRQISYSLIGGLFFACTTSCSNDVYRNKAKAQAAKYLDGYDLLKAERFENQQTNYDQYNGEAIVYWDSLLTEEKVKEAYLKGQQYIKDSIIGNYRRKEKYKPKLDTILAASDVIKCSREEYAKYTNAQNFIKARDNAPSNTHYGRNHLVSSTHYWNLITIAGKQQEAYNQGLIDARNLYKQSK